MHFVYLDESGDSGLRNSPTSHYILAGFSVHHADWRTLDERIRLFRQEAAHRYGFPASKELHAAELLGNATTLSGVDRYQRLLLARHLIHIVARCMEIRTFAWVSAKADLDPRRSLGKLCMEDLMRWAGPGELKSGACCQGSDIFIIHDQSNHPPLPLDGPMPLCIGQPLGQNSRSSPQLQLADLIAFSVKQKYSPNRYMLKSGGVNLYDKLKPVSLGIKELG